MTVPTTHVCAYANFAITLSPLLRTSDKSEVAETTKKAIEGCLHSLTSLAFLVEGKPVEIQEGMLRIFTKVWQQGRASIEKLLNILLQKTDVKLPCLLETFESSFLLMRGEFGSGFFSFHRLNKIHPKYKDLICGGFANLTSAMLYATHIAATEGTEDTSLRIALIIYRIAKTIQGITLSLIRYSNELETELEALFQKLVEEGRAMDLKAMHDAEASG